MTLQQTPTLNAEQTLAQWLTEEAERRAIMDSGPGPGLADPAVAASLDGETLFQQMLAGRLPYAHIARTLDFLMISARKGEAVFQGTPAVAHLNPLGTVHGGWFATLLDSALGCCIHASLPAGKSYTTLELKVNMIRAITPKVPRVRALGRLIHLGGQTAIAEAQLVGPDGKLYAHSTTTCMVFDIRLPGKA